MPQPPQSSKTSEATVRAALETAASGEDRVEQPVSPTQAGVKVSGAGAQSYPVLVGRDHCENTNIHAPGNNVTTTRAVSPSEPKTTPQQGSLTGTETVPSTARPNVPGLVPNPQPIPFPSKAELEKQGYRFGPFTAEHNPVDVEMIAHYARRGYRPLQPHEVDYAEFRCNGVPFALAASVPHRPKPPEPPKPQKTPEELAREELAALLRK
jgi:hypothetical protein